MLYIFILLCIWLLIMSYLLSNRNFLSVSFLTTILFLLSCFVLLLNNNKWKYEMSATTCITLFMNLSCIFLGEIVVRAMTQKIPSAELYDEESINFLDVPQWFFILSVFFIGISALLYFRNIQTIVSSVSGTSDIASYRYAKVNEGVSDNVYISIMKEISYCLCIFYTFIYIFLKRSKKYIIPILLYSIIILLSSGRSQFIYILAAILVFVYYYYKKNGRLDSQVMIKMVRAAVIALSAFLLIFYIAGFITKKSIIYSSAFENISIYLSSSLLAINRYIEEFRYSFANFGSETFFGVINFLRRFGIDLAPQVKNNYLPFLYFPNMGHTTNVYTFIGRLLHDYNYIGSCIVSFLIGLQYTKIEEKIRIGAYKNKLFVIMLFASYFYPIVFSVFDFKYFEIFSITGLIHVLTLYFLSKFVSKLLIIKN